MQPKPQVQTRFIYRFHAISNSLLATYRRRDSSAQLHLFHSTFSTSLTHLRLPNPLPHPQKRHNTCCTVHPPRSKVCRCIHVESCSVRKPRANAPSLCLSSRVDGKRNAYRNMSSYITPFLMQTYHMCTCMPHVVRKL